MTPEEIEDVRATAWADQVEAEVRPFGLLGLGGRPGDVAMLLDLCQPASAARRVVTEALLEVHGARRIGDDDWSITTEQAIELLDGIAQQIPTKEGDQ